ncbi:GNAT family N-acetyltransferase [Halorarius litoreus]|uniref:GNAT family N-acetyltransferase n=1 Tax=Halorarius litoreus TaxID=2962676 RepID=UPI0020CC994A|nr:GNAT family N-acetyltransferase [Halorarius litoreus]
MRIERVDLDTWADALPADGFEVFHTPAALEVVADHWNGETELLVGYNGDQPVAMCPVFVQRRSVGTAVLSPPPSMGIPRLGPLLRPVSPKQRKQEQLNQEFTEGVLETLDLDRGRTLFRVLCPPTYTDPRPFDWQGFDVRTAFTYELDASDTTSDDLQASFSKSLRREIRDAEALDLDVTVEQGVDAVRSVYDDTVARYADQDETFSLDWAYVADLTTALAAEDRCRTYAARTPDGEFVSGITALYSNDAAYFWLGGARTTYENVSINSLLHWRIVEDIATEPPLGTVSRYDLMGANTERLCRYKSKFGADLVPYYVVESGGKRMELAKKAYQLIAR